MHAIDIGLLVIDAALHRLHAGDLCLILFDPIGDALAQLAARLRWRAPPSRL